MDMGNYDLCSIQTSKMNSLRTFSTRVPSLHIQAVFRMMSTENTMESVISRMSSKIDEKTVEDVQAIYLFDLGEDGKWYLDLLNGSGTVSQSEPATPPNCTFSMNSSIFSGLLEGKVNAMTAVMGGKIKIAGDMEQAFKLDKILKQI